MHCDERNYLRSLWGRCTNLSCPSADDPGKFSETPQKVGSSTSLPENFDYLIFLFSFEFFSVPPTRFASIYVAHYSYLIIF